MIIHPSDYGQWCGYRRLPQIFTSWNTVGHIQTLPQQALHPEQPGILISPLKSEFSNSPSKPFLIVLDISDSWHGCSQLFIQGRCSMIPKFGIRGHSAVCTARLQPVGVFFGGGDAALGKFNILVPNGTFGDSRGSNTEILSGQVWSIVGFN